MKYYGYSSGNRVANLESSTFYVFSRPLAFCNTVRTENLSFLVFFLLILVDQLYSALIFSAKSKLFYIIFGVVFYGDNTDGFVKIKGEIRISEHLKKSRIIDLKSGNRIAKQIKKH